MQRILGHGIIDQINGGERDQSDPRALLYNGGGGGVERKRDSRGNRIGHHLSDYGTPPHPLL